MDEPAAVVGSDALRRTLDAIRDTLASAWVPDARDALERAAERPLAELDADGELRTLAERARSALAAAARGGDWWRMTHGAERELLVAYFSAEFGVDDRLPIYSGGLGVLAGDHLKSAAELGVPLVGVGLLYGSGYFRQRLGDDGRQEEDYPPLEPERRPLTLERGPDGAPLVVGVDLPGERVVTQVWRADVGSTRLYLLDTDVEENSPGGRAVTGVLYGGDRELRIRQELVLGVGGVRALGALGLRPSVFHMNEGHAAFLALERLRSLVADAGLSRGQALQAVRASTVFTTHTPVPAGNEVFDPELVLRYAAPLTEPSGLSAEELLALGRARDDDRLFGMTPLALRTAALANGVSRLHGSVSRGMWSALWPGREEDDVPIGHVTNGVHARSWLAREIEELLRVEDVRPEAPPAEQRWDRVLRVSPSALWEAHRSCKRKLVAAAAPEFDPDALTIGFARRFATYKRAGLLFSDRERLARLLADGERPVQVLLAGKAHPADAGGKELVHHVVELSRREFGGRVAFVPDYGISAARLLVQGVDVWLNTPRWPLEASGTSGMKAGMNGVLNLSVLDGWWAEGYDPEIGWAITGGHAEEDTAAQDERDAETLYRLLEEEVVPLYYGDRDRWIEMMKSGIARVGGEFNSHRMVWEYVERYYLPAHRSARAASCGGVGLR